MDPIEKFLEAARAADLDTLRSMLEDDPALREARNNLGQSAILLAQYHRKAEVVDFLLAAGAELNLHEACAIGSLERVRQLLLERGRLIDSYSADGFTPLALAAFFGNLDVAAHLINQGANVNLAATNPMKVAPLHAATASRHFAIVELLVANGADVNQPQHQGWRPLHAAAQHGDEAAVRLLLAHGARANVRSDNRQTPLDLAMTHGHAAVVELLEAATSS
jgi:ankyrin repeat protein